MANRQPDEYPRKPNEYPEIMSKMDPLIIRVSATVLLVGSTTYTAKIKLGYKFNGFVVNVTGVGIPIYTEEVDIANASTTNKSRQNGMSDAYNKVAEKATEWMDNLEKSMIDDTKEKNIVDLLREIKYQMHFDSSGHKYPAIIKPNEPGYNEEEYDPRMEVCTEVPTYITDIYKLLAEMNARLNNLMVVMASDGTGQNINPQDTDYGKNCLINSVNVLYNDTTHGFDVAYNYGDHIDAGLNTRIGDITNPDANSVIGKLDSISTNVDTVAVKVETVHRAIGTGDSDHTVQKQLEAIATDVVSLSGQSATNATTISTAITNGLNQLVAQMNTMNAKIGTPTSTNDGTVFAYLNNNKDVLHPAVMNELASIESKPILGVDVSNTTINNLNTVLNLLNSSTQNIGDRGTDTYIKALNLLGYNMTCWRGLTGHNVGAAGDPSIVEALHNALLFGVTGDGYALREGYTGGDYHWGLQIYLGKI